MQVNHITRGRDGSLASFLFSQPAFLRRAGRRLRGLGSLEFRAQLLHSKRLDPLDDHGCVTFGKPYNAGPKQALIVPL